jgi:hypothetical protein
LKVIARPPGGAIRTFNAAPSRAAPSMLRMKGFHSGYDPKSVRIAHTRSAGAAISIVDCSSRSTFLSSWSKRYVARPASRAGGVSDFPRLHGRITQVSGSNLLDPP